MTDPAIQQLMQQMVATANALQQLAAASSRTTAATEANMRRYADINQELDDYRAGLIKGRKLTKDQTKLDKELQTLKRKELNLQRAYQKALEEAQAAVNSTTKTEEEKKKAALAEQRARRRYTEAQGKTTEVADKLTASFEGLYKGVNIAGAAMVWFGKTIYAAATQAKLQVVASQGMVEGTGSLLGALKDQQDQAFKLGMKGSDYAAITAANRQMVNAMGGSVAATKQLESGLDNFYAMTGSTSEAYKALMESMSSFAQKGVKPTKAVLEQYTSDVKTLAAQTGMSQEAVRQLYDDVASDADSIDLLRNARKEERGAILQSQRALIQQSIAAGMSAEQAKEAAKMLNKMVAAKPLDRLKQAAKMRALGGAMGIAGADKAAEAVIAGKRATADQKKALAEFNTNAANAMDQAAGQGLGSEIFASQLMDKLDMDQYYGKGSPFSTTLGDTLAKPLQEVKDAYVDAGKSAITHYARQGELLADQASLILSGNHYSGMILAGITTIVALLARGKLFEIGKNILGKSPIGKALGKLLPGGASAAAEGGATAVAAGAEGAAEGLAGTAGAAGAAEGSGGAVSGLSKAAGVLAKSLKILGPIASVGAGLYEGYQDYKETGKTGEAVGTGVGTAAGGAIGGWGGAAGGALAGAAIGSVVPIIGTAIGAAIGGIAGGLGGGALGGWLGGKGGKAVGGMFDGPGGPAQPTPQSEQQKKDSTKDALQTTADASNDIKTATMSSADGIQAQLKKMDTQSTTLEKIADMSARQIELAEKQLIALTMTEKERTDSSNRTTLRKDNKFGSQYNYV